MIKLWRYFNRDPKTGQVSIEIPGQSGSLDELTNQLPAGVYTTFRTYHKYSVLNFPAHIQRLEHSARILSKPLNLDQAALHANLRTALENHPAEENRVRIIVTWELPKEGEVIYLAVEDLRTPSPELYRTGVRVNTVPLKRVLPEAKATDFIYQTQQLRAEITNGLNELLMVSENGVILEGLSSNFFAVRDGAVYTISSGVLPGITREFVLEIIRSTSIPLVLDGIHLTDIDKLQEAFITSTSRGVLPVVQIDQTVIGSGFPGPVTKRLMQDYALEIEKRIEPL